MTALKPLSKIRGGSSVDKEEIIYNGVTDDFAWYELSRMRVRLDEMVTMLENLQNTLKARSVEQQSYMNYLEGKVRMLKELVPQDAKE
jgi:hypothetical protein